MIWHSIPVYGDVPTECTCPRAECGGAIEGPGCPWHHTGRAGLHHQADDCADIRRARELDTHARQETPRCDSTHQIPPLTFKCEERQGHRRPHCAHTGGAEVRWLTPLSKGDN